LEHVRTIADESLQASPTLDDDAGAFPLFPTSNRRPPSWREIANNWMKTGSSKHKPIRLKQRPEKSISNRSITALGLNPGVVR
jgi:hypothetical protein